MAGTASGFYKNTFYIKDGAKRVKPSVPCFSLILSSFDRCKKLGERLAAWN
jgi:hypothetical protein